LLTYSHVLFGGRDKNGQTKAQHIYEAMKCWKH